MIISYCFGQAQRIYRWVESFYRVHIDPVAVSLPDNQGDILLILERHLRITDGYLDLALTSKDLYECLPPGKRGEWTAFREDLETLHRRGFIDWSEAPQDEVLPTPSGVYLARERRKLYN